MNTESIELRWKQAQSDFCTALRYPAHALTDVHDLLQYVKELELQNSKLRWLLIKGSGV